ncbi:hypothetical protein Pint_28146 [Pistacia integerrima]|uniref:Uncharacterized protein n=1 Tax=Pistacia integerrima TaxID=434235 RepID=A0ACC0YS82_9ROSI|nr:hypothetical protein Pint_28146 [Pistacia integerrima]
MSRGSEYLRLYRLINDSVRPYAESELVSLTKEQEKELLASLSQILRKVQLWTRELDCDSSDELETHSDDHLYLSKIIVDMVINSVIEWILCSPCDARRGLIYAHIGSFLNLFHIDKSSSNATFSTAVVGWCKAALLRCIHKRNENGSIRHIFTGDVILLSVKIFLLGVKSHFVQHLAANILVVISELLSTSVCQYIIFYFGSNWNLLIRSLFCCMELAIINILSIASAPFRAESGNSHFDSSSFVGVIKPRLKYAGWSSLAGIVRILRNILKSLKQEYDYDDSLTEAYLHSVYSCLSTVPWDSMDLICGTQSSCSAGVLHLRTADEEQSKVVFLGNIIQFLCSLVEHISSVDDMGSSLDKYLILSVVTKLVPKLLYWCLNEPGECVRTRISQYFRHKLLVRVYLVFFLINLEIWVFKILFNNFGWEKVMLEYSEVLVVGSF